MSEAAKILKKKKALKAELERLLPENESDALWKKAESRLGEIRMRYSSPKTVTKRAALIKGQSFLCADRTNHIRQAG